MTFVRVAWQVLRKDLIVEVRSLEVALTTLFFAVAVVMVFAFALVREGEPPTDGAAGILWISIAFAGTLALGRTFERERQSDTLRALLLTPVPRPAIYVGKLLAIVALLLGAAIVLLPLIAFLFQTPLFARPLWLSAVLIGGTVGFAAVGTLFAAMLTRSRSRDVLLPVLLYPITVPVIIAGVRATALLVQPELDVPLARFWLSLLLAFDVVFVTLALWTFEPLMSD